LMGKPDGKKPCTYLREIKCSGVDWTGLAQERDKWRVPLNAVMMLRVR
jgi:hypothetical protein